MCCCWRPRLWATGTHSGRRVPRAGAGLVAPFPWPERHGDDLPHQHGGLRRRALVVPVLPFLVRRHQRPGLGDALSRPAAGRDGAGLSVFQGSGQLRRQRQQHFAVRPGAGHGVGGPNKDYGGIAKPPGASTYYERFYRDWIDNSPNGWYRTKVWEVNENSISYQGPYVALIAAIHVRLERGRPTGPAFRADRSRRHGRQLQPDRSGLERQHARATCSATTFTGAASGGPYDLIYGGTTTSAHSDVRRPRRRPTTTWSRRSTTPATRASIPPRRAPPRPAAPARCTFIRSADGAQKGSNSGRWIDVYVKTNAGAAVPDATVTVTASGFDNQTNQNITQTKSGVTGSDGKVRVVSPTTLARCASPT